MAENSGQTFSRDCPAWDIIRNSDSSPSRKRDAPETENESKLRHSLRGTIASCRSAGRCAPFGGTGGLFTSG